MPELPERLICQATLDGKPVSGVLLRIGFGVWEKNAYDFIFGPTNYDGCAVLTKERILEEVNAQANLALMDYGPLEKVFSGDISLRAIGVDEIKRAIEGYEQFHKSHTYPPQYRENLESALQSPVIDRVQGIQTKCLI